MPPFSWPPLEQLLSRFPLLFASLCFEFLSPHVLARVFFHAEFHFVIFSLALNELDYAHAVEHCQFVTPSVSKIRKEAESLNGMK